MAQKISLRDDAVLEGFAHYQEALSAAEVQALVAELDGLLTAAPLYTPTMPRTGAPLSVAMSNCGALGWVSDKQGYRYQAHHPETGAPWPAMPERLFAIWRTYGGYPHPPEACLINRYRGKARLGLHIDQDEDDPLAPVVSVSLGDDAWFRLGGRARRDPTQRVLLRSGDVVVLGGPARFAYHGVDRIVAGTSDAVPGGGRINLTMRRVTRPL